MHEAASGLGVSKTGIGQPVRRREDLRLVTGHGRYSDDLNLPEPGLCGVRPLAACPCADPQARHRARAKAAPGVLAVLTSDEVRAGRAQSAAAYQQQPPRRYPHHRTRTARRSSGRSTSRSSSPRCAMSARSSRSWSRRASPRPRTPPSWSTIDWEVLPAVAHGLAAADAGAPRARLDSPNIILDGEVGDEAATDGGLRQGGACREIRHLGAAHLRRADGAARRGRRIRPGDRHAHAARRRRRRGQPAPRPGDGVRRPARAGAHGDARYRRQFRHARLVQRRVRARRVGGEAARPAGQMDLRAAGIFRRRLPGARSRLSRRAGARRRGQIPRDARLEPGQPGRLCDRLRLAQQGRRDHVEHLPRAGGAFPRPRGADQHARRPGPIAARAGPR